MEVYAFGKAGWPANAIQRARGTVDPIGIRWQVHDRWAAFERAVPTAHVAVVAVGEPNPDTMERLRSLTRRSIAGIVVLSQRGLRLPELTRLHVLPPGLKHLTDGFPGALHGARADGVLFSQALRIEAAGHLEPLFRRMLVVPMVSPRPPHTMKALGESLPRSVNDFRYRWRGGADGGTPKTFLSWVNLERAVVSRPADRAWERHALETGHVLQTLRRTSARLLDLTLDEAAVRHGEAVIRGFDDFLAASLRVEMPGRPGGGPSANDPMLSRMSRSSPD